MRIFKISSKNLLILFFLSSLVMRFYLVLERPPFADEIWALFLTRASFKDIWLGTYAEMIAPLYFLLVHAFSSLLKPSFSILGLRLMALFWGILSSILISFLASLVSGKKEGMIALFLSLFLPASVWAAVFARYYSFLIFLSSLAMILFIRYLQTRKRGNIFWLVFLSAIGTYTHHYFSLLFLSFGVYLILTRKSRQLILGWFYGLGSLFILMMPGLCYLLVLPKPQFWRSTNNLLKIPASLLVNVFSFETLLYLYEQGWQIYFLALACFLVFLLYLLKRGLEGWKSDLWVLFLAVLIFPPLVALIVSYLFRPVFGLNSLLIFLPAFIVVLARGINLLIGERGFLKILLLLLLFLSLIPFFQSSLREPMWMGPFLFVKNELKERDLVLHADIYTYIQAKYYLEKEVNFGIISTIYLPQTEKALGYQKISRGEIEWDQGRIWYFEPGYFNVKDARDFKDFLDDNFVLEKKKDFKESLTSVYLYSRGGR